MTSAGNRPILEALAARFIRFADREAGAYAPFYDRLARAIAGDPAALAIALHTRAGQQAPNLLLAAIHYLVLGGASHTLATWYPDLGDGRGKGDLSSDLHSFCHEHQEELEHLVATRLVQTNEVQRSGFLLPAFGQIAGESDGRALALIEVGASAGLNLLFDRYAYRFGDKRHWGDPAAPVLIRCAVRGPLPVPLPLAAPAIGFRAGIDLNPVRVDAEDDILWLKALVWPEHADRAALLSRALDMARADPPTLISGDVLNTLPVVATAVPTDLLLCIFHTSTVAHFTAEARERFPSLIRELADQRDLCWLSSEGPMLPGAEPALPLRLVRFSRGAASERLLARHHPHGSWVEWQ